MGSCWVFLDKPVAVFEVVVMTLTAILTQDPDGGYVALNPETGTTTQGDNFSEALANLKEATELYLEVFPAPQKVASLMTTFEVAHA